MGARECVRFMCVCMIFSVSFDSSILFNSCLKNVILDASPKFTCLPFTLIWLEMKDTAYALDLVRFKNNFNDLSFSDDLIAQILINCLSFSLFETFMKF